MNTATLQKPQAKYRIEQKEFNKLMQLLVEMRSSSDPCTPRLPRKWWGNALRSTISLKIFLNPRTRELLGEELREECNLSFFREESVYVKYIAFPLFPGDDWIKNLGIQSYRGRSGAMLLIEGNRLLFWFQSEVPCRSVVIQNKRLVEEQLNWLRQTSNHGVSNFRLAQHDELPSNESLATQEDVAGDTTQQVLVSDRNTWAQLEDDFQRLTVDELSSFVGYDPSKTNQVNEIELPAEPDEVEQEPSTISGGGRSKAYEHLAIISSVLAIVLFVLFGSVIIYNLKESGSSNVASEVDYGFLTLLSLKGTWNSDGSPMQPTERVELQITGNEERLSLVAECNSNKGDSILQVFRLSVDRHPSTDFGGVYWHPVLEFPYHARINSTIKDGSGVLVQFDLVNPKYPQISQALILEVIEDSLFYFLTDGEITSHDSRAIKFVRSNQSRLAIAQN